MAEARQGRGGSRRSLWVVGGLLALVVLGFLAYLKPIPPLRVDLLTGPEGSSYYALGKAFQRELARQGIHARLVETRGALDNLERLTQATPNTLAFAQSNIEKYIDDEEALGDLASLGSIAFEPLWVFVQDGVAGKDIRGLRGRRAAIGSPGGGSRAIAELLLEANGLSEEVETAPFDGLSEGGATEDLISGNVDAVFLVGGTESVAISRLLQAEGVTPLSLQRGATYAVLFPGLVPFAVPSGVVDLAADIPKETIHTVAATTSMLVKREIHGALGEALIDAAKNLQTRPTLESPDGVFPTQKFASLPLEPGARRYYQEGPSKLSRHLPYWASALVNQLVFVVLPALAVLFTVLKVIPGVLGLRFQLKSLALTRTMVRLEQDLIQGKNADTLLAELDDVDRAAAAMHVPSPKAAAYLELRQNVHDARERITARHQSA